MAKQRKPDEYFYDRTVFLDGYTLRGLMDPNFETGVALIVTDDQTGDVAQFTTKEAILRLYNLAGEMLGFAPPPFEAESLNRRLRKCTKCPGAFIWLASMKSGKPVWIPTVPETLMPGDKVFDPKRHKSHMPECHMNVLFPADDPAREENERRIKLSIPLGQRRVTGGDGPLEQAALKPRTITLLAKAGITTMVELFNTSWVDLSLVKGIGPYAIAEILELYMTWVEPTPISSQRKKPTDTLEEPSPPKG